MGYHLHTADHDTLAHGCDPGQLFFRAIQIFHGIPSKNGIEDGDHKGEKINPYSSKTCHPGRIICIVV